MDLIDHKNTEFSKNIFLKIYVHSFQHISQITYDNIYTLANNQINASTTSKQNESFVYIVPWCHETNWEVTSFTARSATEAPLYNSECWLLFMMSRQNINCLNARSYFANNYHNLWYFDCVWCQVGNAAKCLCFKDKIVKVGNIGINPWLSFNTTSVAPRSNSSQKVGIRICKTFCNQRTALVSPTRILKTRTTK